MLFHFGEPSPITQITITITIFYNMSDFWKTTWAQGKGQRKDDYLGTVCPKIEHTHTNSFIFGLAFLTFLQLP